MPCWFYDKKDLRVTPSSQNGLDAQTEARYRREGARFIIDAGAKMGLRHDTCSTGVIYFHRFYMFHSFTEFHRYVIGASCLFLSGKVEETPKKCKDVVKICRTLLTEEQFLVFKDNPREEIMTSERILLQTLKFDLQVEHPYAHIVRMAKLIFGDKQKLQKVVQMAWTFINDSLCTTLCLQWEAEIIAASMLYLSTRLSKFEVTDWVGRVPGGNGKWWEALVEGLCQELIEDICHQVLDLYSSSAAQKGQESPPISSTSALNTQSDSSEGPTPKKAIKKDNPSPTTPTPEPAYKQGNPYPQVPASYPAQTYASTQQQSTSQFTQNNPYVSSQMYSSSFMTGEASQSIQTLIHQDDRSHSAYPHNAPIASYQKNYHDPNKFAAHQPYGYHDPSANYSGYSANVAPAAGGYGDVSGVGYPPQGSIGGYPQPPGGYYNRTQSQPGTPLAHPPAAAPPTVRITSRHNRH